MYTGVKMAPVLSSGMTPPWTISVSILTSGIHSEDCAPSENDREVEVVEEAAEGCDDNTLSSFNFSVAAMDDPAALLPLLQLEFRKRIHGEDAERVVSDRTNFWESIIVVLLG